MALISLVLLASSIALSQPADTVNWAVGLGGRFEKLNNPVVSSYALGQLGGLVCEHDKVAGAGLYRQALARLNTLSDNLFEDSQVVLPVSSFKGLRRSIMPAAERCDPALGQLLDRRTIDGRIAAERSRANLKIDTAAQALALNPARAAQLLDGAISTGDPDTFDVARFAGLLSALQPELADDVFAKALEVALTERAPRIKFLGELGAFVFSASAANVPTPAVQRPASAQRAAQVAVQQALQSTPERTTVIAGVTIRDITALHPNTDPFNVDAYIGAVLEALKAPDNPYYDAPTAYAIVYQLLATARAMELDTAPSLEQALSKIQVSASVARQVQEFVKGGFAPVPDSTSRKDRLIDQVISAIHLKHFDVARNLLVDLDDRDLRAQLGVLIVFGQAKDALEAKDFEGAFQFANMLRPSVKRVLVYDGFMAGAPPEQALQAVSLAVKDADLLSAAYRAEVLSAAATALMRSDPDRALSVINEVVKSLNNASSRTSNFDPKRFGSTDMAQILVRPTRLDEVVASDRQWHIFALQLPGVSPFTLPAVLRATASTDPARLEAALLEIRDETRLASALNALAELRLNPR